MASLRSMIVDGNRFASPPDMTAAQDETELAYVSHTLTLLRSQETVLVNADKVARDLTEAMTQGVEVRDHPLIPCPKPPFHRIWLECNQRFRSGALVERKDIRPGEDPLEALTISGKTCELEEIKVFQMLRQQQPATVVMAHAWQEIASRAAASFLGELLYWLDGNGNWQGGTVVPFPPEAANVDDRMNVLDSFLVWVLHTFARLNCHNVKLVPMKAGAPSAKQLRKHHAPSTVWHEIVVEEVQVRAKRDAPASGEKQELRFHRVRGHYADYTKGAGLFGKYKLRLWVEEHARGNPELGEVVGSYSVQ